MKWDGATEPMPSKHLAADAPNQAFHSPPPSAYISSVPHMLHPAPMFQAQRGLKLGDALSGSDVNSTSERVVKTAVQSPTSSCKVDLPIPRGSRKRKCPAVTLPDSIDTKHLPTKKNSHNLIEKRYRTNLNDKIAQLRDSVPSLRLPPKQTSVNAGQVDSDCSDEGEESSTAQKLNKATILTKATEYIQHLEKRNQRLEQENISLRNRLQTVEQLTHASPLTPLHGSNDSMLTAMMCASPQLEDYNQHSMQAMQSTENAQGWIKVPDDIRGLRNSSFQPHYADPGAYQHPLAQSLHGTTPEQPRFMGPTGRFVGKLMVGSLAGLMIVEGFSEKENGSEKTHGRGLFALPTELLPVFKGSGAFLYKNVLALASATLSRKLIPFLKFVAFAMVMLFVVFLYLFNSKPKLARSTSRKATTRLSSAPSLASPLELRQCAWLTSIQTVWVPQHRILHEMAALSLKFLKYSVRRAIGWRGYSWLTGCTEAEELSRVRAWDIAIDAQLAGGDADISKSRLVLTILAAGTLPNTSARLMLKALHIRLLLWVAVRSQWTILYPLHRLAAIMARQQWRLARHLQNIPEDDQTKSPDAAESLPEHLGKLLELPCDTVMTDPVIQRAYNLAWNRPTCEDTEGADVGMDIVTEDYAIRSPLDALAAWWSSNVLHRALLAALETGNQHQSSVFCDLKLALRTAPPASSAHTRALAATALFMDDDRAANIAAALKALPSSDRAKDGEAKRSTTFVDSSTPMPACNGIRIAVRCAMTLSTLSLHMHDPESIRTATDSLLFIQLDPNNLSLLGFVAAYHLLRVLHRAACSASQFWRSLRQPAAALCDWVSSDAARDSGLGECAGNAIKEECEKIARHEEQRRRLSAGSTDTGYVSMSETE